MSISSDDLVGVFTKIYQTSGALPAGEMRGAFVELARRFLISPTAPQRQYLASISQGFFLYHMVGLDPTCAKIRKELFSRTVWFCDSSVLLLVVAVGSHNHEYARNLFVRLLDVGPRVFVTRRMITGAWQHLDWAIRFVEKNPAITPGFLSAVLVQPGYKQNLFLDGFVRLAADGRVGTFEDYLGLISPEKLTFANFSKRLVESGINIVDMAVFEGYQVEDLGDLPTLQLLIRADRAARDILRSDLQVEAEAEVLYIIDSLAGC